jgi:hypothetical protein
MSNGQMIEIADIEQIIAVCRSRARMAREHAKRERDRVPWAEGYDPTQAYFCDGEANAYEAIAARLRLLTRNRGQLSEEV